MVEDTRKKEIDEYAKKAASGTLGKVSHADEEEQYSKAMRESGPYLTLGIQMAITVAAFSGLGYWLDNRFNTSPLWIAILSGLGAVMGLAYFLLTVTRLSKKDEIGSVTKAQKRGNESA